MNAKQSVLLVHPFDAFAGAQRVASAIVDTLENADGGISVRLGFGGRGFLSELPVVDPDIRCDHIPTRKLLYPFWSFFALFPIAWAAARGRIVWANTIHSLPPALLAVLLFPRRTLVHVHEATLPGVFRLLLKLAAWRGATIVCVSADQAQRIGIDSQTLPNPVAQPIEDAVSLQDRLLFVGTTKPIKGFELFISVCERLAGSPLRKAAYLSDKAECDHRLLAQAQSAGIVIVFGEQSPDAMYRDGFLFLMCSDASLVSETFSLVAAEATAWLVPVGGAGATVLPEVLGDALAFNEASRNADRIAQQIMEIYESADRHAALRAKCEARRSHFSQAAFAERVAHLLQRITTQ